MVVFLNGTDKQQTLDLSSYKEVLPSITAIDFAGKEVHLDKSLTLKERETLILTFWYSSQWFIFICWMFNDK